MVRAPTIEDQIETVKTHAAWSEDPDVAIEFFGWVEQKWVSIDRGVDPEWRAGILYRLKPEPELMQLRQYTMEELRHLVGKVVRGKSSNELYQVIYTKLSGVGLAGYGDVGPGELLLGFTRFDDGTACGVAEE